MTSPSETTSDLTSSKDSGTASDLDVDTKTLEETICYTWKINNFDQVRRSNELIFGQRKEFKMGSGIGTPTKWKFFLLPKVEDWIGCYIQLMEAPKFCKGVDVFLTINIKKPNGDKFFFKEHDVAKNMIDNTCEAGKYFGFGCNRVISRTANVNELPLVDGVLTIQFQLKMCDREKPTTEKSVEDKMKDFEILFLRRLSDELDGCCDLNLNSTGDNDTKIISKDQDEFKVNRGILSARSVFFKTMFQTKMTESETGIIRLDYLSSKVVTVLLKYINAAKLHKDWKDDDVIEDLISAAHKFELQTLLEFLDHILINICTIENAKRLAVLAKRMGLEKAQMDLFRFIKKNANDLENLILFVDDGL